jgi:hypothetical protein
MSARGTYRVDGYGVGMAFDGKIIEMDSLQCCHCNVHYHVRPGSGKQRGWCTMCSQPTCGRSACAVCVPFERKLVAQERRALRG